MVGWMRYKYLVAHIEDIELKYSGIWRYGNRLNTAAAGLDLGFELITFVRLIGTETIQIVNDSFIYSLHV